MHTWLKMIFFPLLFDEKETHTSSVFVCLRLLAPNSLIYTEAMNP